MSRSLFRRAHADAPPIAHPGVLPLSLEAALDVALDGTGTSSARIAAVARLEHGAGRHAFEVARRLTPSLAAPPDVAARVHLALIVLAPRLAIARAPDGGFVASAHSYDDASDDGIARIDRVLGRVVTLDALATLFGPHEDAPAFLAPTPASAPTPYRPAPEVLARLEHERARAQERVRRRVELMRLGLDEEDLEDDAEERLRAAPRHIARRDAHTVVHVDAHTELALESDGRRVPLGVAHPGDWWSDVRVGDHKGAQRLLVRLARDDDASEVRVRRAPKLSARGGSVAVVFGDARIEHVIHGFGVVAFCEERDGAIVGVTLTWSTRRGARPSTS